ncbi:MAG: WD40/YVTN/BNR-like repeat-containing protein, partial [Alphaproteobacteria bacterium]
LEPGGAAETGVLWAGTQPGALFRSADGGASWTLIESLWRTPERAEWFGGGNDYPGIHSVLVDPRDPRRVTVGVSVGGVWRSTDAGATWTCHGEGMNAEYLPPEQQAAPHLQDVHRLAACAARPDVVWTQHHNGVFRSTDGGRTWRVITTIRPSHFGFAVAAHPHDPETAWFVPAIKDECRVPVDGRVVVARTRDGGRSFSVHGKGLPARNAYDLVYRHALDVDGSGAVLAMGSTTGALWTSQDGGEVWRLVSAHLPPINAVRFVPGD